MKLLLLGNRGSKPLGASPNSPFEKMGGDTTTMGIIFEEDNTVVAIDGGSGFWKWPYTLQNYANMDAPYDIHMFFTHYHMDHTMGLPQSPLLFTPGNEVKFYGPDAKPSMQAVLTDMASRPANPDLAAHYQAALQFNALPDRTNTPITLPNGAKVKWIALPHGDEFAHAYRFEHNGRSICIISDAHHEFDEQTDEPLINDELVEFISDADVLVYDSHFTDAELKDTPFFRSFGHSTGEHGVRLCAEANIPMLIKHHHDPNKIDSVLIEETLQLQRYADPHGVTVFAAQPSMCIDLALSMDDLIMDMTRQTLDRESRFTAISRINVPDEVQQTQSPQHKRMPK